MFSGLVETQATVRDLQQNGAHLQLSLHLGDLFEALNQGDSLSIDGVCMTVRQLKQKDLAYFDVLPATLEKTTIGLLSKDKRVNIERALRSDQRLGGHIVQGHVDGKGIVSRISNHSPRIMEIFLSPELSRNCVQGGSIAVNGVSLTIARQLEQTIEVQLIPETLERTNLSVLQEGDEVNVECDVLSRYANMQSDHTQMLSKKAIHEQDGLAATIRRVENCLAAVQQGEMVIIFDNVDRENEGDFFIPAQRVSADDVTFMAREGCGLICAPITIDIAQSLELPLMVEENDALHKTMFTVSIDVRKGSTTGIASEERAHCMRLLGNPQAHSEDFVRPGHVFPLIAHPDGMQKRQGHTEAAVFLASQAGFSSAGVICEILNKQGNPARWNELQNIATTFQMQLVSISDLLVYQREIQKG